MPGAKDEDQSLYFLLDHSNCEGSRTCIRCVCSWVSLGFWGVRAWVSPEGEMLNYWVFVSSFSVNHAKLLDKVVLLIFTPALRVWLLLLFPRIAYFWYCSNCSSLPKMCCGSLWWFWFCISLILMKLGTLSSLSLFYLFGYLDFFFCVIWSSIWLI